LAIRLGTLGLVIVLPACSTTPALSVIRDAKQTRYLKENLTYHSTDLIDQGSRELVMVKIWPVEASADFEL
jgi:hypothetical protein